MAVQKQQRLLALEPPIIFATPGRALELLQADQLRLIETVVIDEADRMLERGQFSDLVNICKLVNQVHSQEG